MIGELIVDFKLYERVPKSLIQAGFVVYWERIDQKQRDVVTRKMADVLDCPATPAPMRETLLAIVDFILRGNVTRLPPPLLSAAKHALALQEQTLTEKVDPLW